MLQSIRKLRIQSWTHRTVVNVRWFSDDEKFEKKSKGKREESKEKSEKNVKNQESVKKLNALLGSMPLASKSKIKIQKPKKKEKPAEPPKPQETRTEKIISVTEKIAEKIGGDVKQTQAELMAKLLGTEGLQQSESMKELLSALKVEDKPNNERRVGSDHSQQRSDRTEYRNDHSRADVVRKALGPKRERMLDQRSAAAPPTGVVDLFGAKPLGLFDGASKVKDPLTTWSKLEQRELKLAVTHPPANYFEKMIMWTEQGRLWKFPIDNEQGWEEEQKVDFSEHVLLEMHLDGWCPTSGPVRHFMELVCVGLSKNHFLSAKEKKDHVLWYRDYFEEKKDLLGELMIMGKTPQLEESQTKLEA